MTLAFHLRSKSVSIHPRIKYYRLHRVLKKKFVYLNKFMYNRLKKRVYARGRSLSLFVQLINHFLESYRLIFSVWRHKTQLPTTKSYILFRDGRKANRTSSVITVFCGTKY